MLLRTSLRADKRRPRLPGGVDVGVCVTDSGSGGEALKRGLVAGVRGAVACGSVTHCASAVQAVVVRGDRCFVACLGGLALSAPVDVGDGHEDLPSFNSIVPHGG